MDSKLNTQAHIDNLITALRSDNPMAAKEAESAIRTLETQTPALMQSLLDILGEPSTEPALVQRAVRLLVDIKYSALVPLLGQAIQKQNQPERLAELISIAWQSRLDFSPILPTLAMHLASDHLNVAIEAMTALEIAVDHATTEQLRELLQRIKELQKAAIPPHAASLLDELYSTASTALQQKTNALRNEKNEKH